MYRNFNYNNMNLKNIVKAIDRRVTLRFIIHKDENIDLEEGN